MPGHILSSLWNMQWKRSKGYGDDTIEIDNSIKEWVEVEELDWAKLKKHYWANDSWNDGKAVYWSLLDNSNNK